MPYTPSKYLFTTLARPELKDLMSHERKRSIELTFACPDVSTVNKPIKVYGILDELQVLFVLQVLRGGRRCLVQMFEVLVDARFGI